MKKSLRCAAPFFAALIFFGCQKAGQANIANEQIIKPVPSSTPNLVTEAATRISVPELAGKSPPELEKILGAPEKITPATARAEIPGEYRLYKLAGQPKGLSVRFYRGRAVRFNLILARPFASAADALRENFGIDVKNSAPTVEQSEPLSRKWRGEFGGVKFSTVYAKKDKPDGQFVMVHAEIDR